MNPPKPLSQFLVAANLASAVLAEKAARQLMMLAPNSEALLQPLIGNSLLLQIDDLEIGYYWLFEAEGLVIKAQSSRLVDKPDVIIHGPLSAFLAAANDTGFDDLTLQGDLQFSGSIQTAKQVEQLFKQLEPDFDEPLARVFGDVAGHQIASAIRSLIRWLNGVIRSAQADLSEYLQHELGVTPSHLEQEDFAKAVSLLRRDSDRLMARIQRLRRQLERPPEQTAMDGESRG